MLKWSLLIFDEYLPLATSTAPVYTAADWNQKLAENDQLAFHIIVDNVDTPGRIYVQLEHSADGEHWIPKWLFGNVATGSAQMNNNDTLTNVVTTAGKFFQGMNISGGSILGGTTIINTMAGGSSLQLSQASGGGSGPITGGGGAGAPELGPTAPPPGTYAAIPNGNIMLLDTGYFIPMLALLRLKIWFTTTTKGHVRIYASARD